MIVSGNVCDCKSVCLLLRWWMRVVVTKSLSVVCLSSECLCSSLCARLTSMFVSEYESVIVLLSVLVTTSML